MFAALKFNVDLYFNEMKCNSTESKNAYTHIKRKNNVELFEESIVFWGINHLNHSTWIKLKLFLLKDALKNTNNPSFICGKLY